jgi:hypothetical protein
LLLPGLPGFLRLNGRRRNHFRRASVHQELARKLAEQARINRLADQLRRACPGGPAA